MFKKEEVEIKKMEEEQKYAELLLPNFEFILKPKLQIKLQSI